jgi:hypothetical protein
VSSPLKPSLTIESIKPITKLKLSPSSSYLLNEDEVLVKDKELFKKFEVIQSMDDKDTKNMIVRFLDLAIRDFKARQAYAS